jgi:hypothetical protein
LSKMEIQDFFWGGLKVCVPSKTSKVRPF